MYLTLEFARDGIKTFLSIKSECIVVYYIEAAAYAPISGSSWRDPQSLNCSIWDFFWVWTIFNRLGQESTFMEQGCWFSLSLNALIHSWLFASIPAWLTWTAEYVYKHIAMHSFGHVQWYGTDMDTNPEKIRVHDYMYYQIHSHLTW